jgi:hypothetical protein
LAPAYRAEAIERARQLAPVLAELKGAGMSARQMAAELMKRGIPTATGARWHAQTVIRVLERVGMLTGSHEERTEIGKHHVVHMRIAE